MLTDTVDNQSRMTRSLIRIETVVYEAIGPAVNYIVGAFANLLEVMAVTAEAYQTLGRFLGTGVIQAYFRTQRSVEQYLVGIFREILEAKGWIKKRPDRTFDFMQEKPPGDAPPDRPNQPRRDVL